MRTLNWTSTALCFALCTFGNSVFAGTLTRLPDWFGAESVRSLFMLPDGHTFIGIDGADVFRWTAANGRSNLGTINPDYYGSPVHASNVSDDGSTIIGYFGEHEYGAAGGFVWNASNGMRLITDISDGGLFNPVPTAVSADGSRIVGHGTTFPRFPSVVGDPAAFLWTSQAGMQSLGFAGYPQAISADGNTVVGSLPRSEITSEAFRWTENSGVQSLGYLQSELPSSSASHVTSDGSLVVGGSSVAPPVFGPRAFRWTDPTGLQELTTRGNDQTVIGISADGSVMYGSMRTLVPNLPGPTFTHDAFVWSEQIGLRTLPEIIAALDVEQELPFSSPNMNEQLLGISGDGSKLFGLSVEFIFGPPAFPNAPIGPTISSVRYEHWALDISAVPEPSSYGLCLLGLALTCARGRANILRGQK
jgi:uncharacterized membrane protein